MWIFIKIVRLLFEIFDIQNFPTSQSRFLCRMISRESCFNFFILNRKRNVQFQCWTLSPSMRVVLFSCYPVFGIVVPEVPARWQAPNALPSMKNEAYASYSHSSPNAIWRYLHLSFALLIAHSLFTFYFAGNTDFHIIVILLHFACLLAKNSYFFCQ